MALAVNAAVPGGATDAAAAAAKSTALLVALDDGPRGKIELQAWSDFARAAQERRKTAALGPGGGEQGGPGRRGGSKGWSWRWGGGSPGEGQKEGAAAAAEGQEEMKRGGSSETAEGRDGDDGASLLFPRVWVITSDPAVDRMIREGMPYLLPFFVPGAFGHPVDDSGGDDGDGGGGGVGGGPDAAAEGDGSVARTSSASVVAEAAVEAGARAEASRLTAAGAARAVANMQQQQQQQQPPAGDATDELANRRRATAAVEAADQQPAAEVKQEEKQAARASAAAREETTIPPGEEEGASLASTRRRASAEAGGGGAGGGATNTPPPPFSWSAVLERFLAENPSVDVFGVFGEGALPTSALLPGPLASTAAGAGVGHRSGASVDRIGGSGGGGDSREGRVVESLLWPVLSKSIPPTVVVSRTRAWWMRDQDEEEEEEEEAGEAGSGDVLGGGGGEGEWMSDRFIAQVRERVRDGGADALVCMCEVYRHVVPEAFACRTLALFVCAGLVGRLRWDFSSCVCDALVADWRIDPLRRNRAVVDAAVGGYACLQVAVF